MARPSPTTRVVAVDWSGAARHEERTLRAAVAEGDGVRRVLSATREAAADLLLDEAARHPNLMAGLDFSFSMPAWWLAACGIDAALELWSDAARLERWLAAGDPPFWGRPGRRRPAEWPGDPLRLTERLAPGHPASVFQIGGAGAVGTASLRGMPVLARLRAQGLAVWPFDRWRPPVVAEVWPRLALGRVVKSDPAARAAWADRHQSQLHPGVGEAVTGSPDALDAAAAALWLGDRIRSAGAAPPFVAGTDPAVRLEGWIAGVEPPVTSTGLATLRGPQ